MECTLLIIVRFADKYTKHTVLASKELQKSLQFYAMIIYIISWATPINDYVSLRII